MEIGTWRGGRARRLLKFCPNPVAYYGFDLFEDLSGKRKMQEFCAKMKPPSLQKVQEAFNQKRFKDTGKEIFLFKGDTVKLLPSLISSGKLPQMDLVFIDGGHSIETINSDWENVKNLMHEQTIVIFDDWFFETDSFGCRKTVEGIDRKEYSVNVLEEYKGNILPYGITAAVVKVTKNVKSP